MEASELAARLVELENRAMHQEHLLDKLNAVIVEQRNEIDRLGREVGRLREQLAAAPQDAGGHDEKPPHY